MPSLKTVALGLAALSCVAALTGCPSGLATVPPMPEPGVVPADHDIVGRWVPPIDQSMDAVHHLLRTDDAEATEDPDSWYRFNQDGTYVIETAPGYHEQYTMASGPYIANADSSIELHMEEIVSDEQSGYTMHMRMTIVLDLQVVGTDGQLQLTPISAEQTIYTAMNGLVINVQRLDMPFDGFVG